MDGVEGMSIGQLVISALVLEQIILEAKDDPRVGEPKRQLALITDELDRRCPGWKEKKSAGVSECESVGEKTTGIRIYLKSADMKGETING